MKDWETHKKKLLKDKAVRRALKESELEYQIARSIIRARINRGLTQAQLAKKVKTRQSVISRLESVKTVPTLSFLKRLAEGLNASLRIQLE